MSSGLFCSPFGPVSPSPAASFGVTPSVPSSIPRPALSWIWFGPMVLPLAGSVHLDAVRAVERDPVLGGARAADRVPRARHLDPAARVRDRRDAVDVGADEVARDRVPVARPAPAGREHRDAAAVARDDVAADRVVVRVRELDPVDARCRSRPRRSGRRRGSCPRPCCRSSSAGSRRRCQRLSTNPRIVVWPPETKKPVAFAPALTPSTNTIGRPEKPGCVVPSRTVGPADDRQRQRGLDRDRPGADGEPDRVRPRRCIRRVDRLVQRAVRRVAGARR